MKKKKSPKTITPFSSFDGNFLFGFRSLSLSMHLEITIKMWNLLSWDIGAAKCHLARLGLCVYSLTTWSSHLFSSFPLCPNKVRIRNHSLFYSYFWNSALILARANFERSSPFHLSVMCSFLYVYCLGIQDGYGVIVEPRWASYYFISKGL